MTPKELLDNVIEQCSQDKKRDAVYGLFVGAE